MQIGCAGGLAGTSHPNSTWNSMQTWRPPSCPTTLWRWRHSARKRVKHVWKLLPKHHAATHYYYIPIHPRRVACNQAEDMVGSGNKSITIAMALQRHCAACNATLSCSDCAGGLSCQSFGSVTRFDAGSMDVKQKRSAVHNDCRCSGFGTNKYTRNCTLKT